MLIQPIIKNLFENGPASTAPEAPTGTGSTSFADQLQSKIGEVNNLQNQADKAMQHSSAGGIDGIPETMIKLEEANMGLLMVAKVRDKALQAYQQVMQMQF
ncbi:MAG: flagellar hook-basal body complex protein FliE [Syntrophobacteraceae bacterium]|nr:flagellar hook-basal body complex protein FliE [Syntrophobacteraceae bacterium]